MLQLLLEEVSSQGHEKLVESNLQFMLLNFEATSSTIGEVVKEHKELFQEPKGLPSQRGSSTINSIEA